MTQPNPPVSDAEAQEWERLLNRSAWPDDPVWVIRARLLADRARDKARLEAEMEDVAQLESQVAELAARNAELLREREYTANILQLTTEGRHQATANLAAAKERIYSLEQVNDW